MKCTQKLDKKLLGCISKKPQPLLNSIAITSSSSPTTKRSKSSGKENNHSNSCTKIVTKNTALKSGADNRHPVDIFFVFNLRYHDEWSNVGTGYIEFYLAFAEWHFNFSGRCSVIWSHESYDCPLQNRVHHVGNNGLYTMRYVYCLFTGFVHLVKN